MNQIRRLLVTAKAANYLKFTAAESGTFTKAAGMTGWETGENGIPSGWTVQNAA